MNRHIRFIPYAFFALGLALAAAVPATAEAAGFIKIAGIDGESRDAAHKGEIDVLSFQWGGETSAAGASSTSRKRQHDWITITRRVDKASPKLQEASVKGALFPSMTLFLPDSEQNARAPYIKYELKDVVITSYSVSGAGDSSIPTETLSLNFDKITPAPKEKKTPPNAKAAAASDHG